MSVLLWVLIMFCGACYLVGELYADITRLSEWRARNLVKSEQLWNSGTWPQKLWAVILLWGCNAALMWVWFIRFGLLVGAGVIALFVWRLFSP